MQKIISILLIGAVLSSCAGKTPNPIQTHRANDNQLSCSSIQMEMDEIDGRIRSLLPKSEKTGKNVGLGIAGAFLLVPWFFMDFSDAERVEIDAYRTRYNHLARLHNEKKCGITKEAIPEFKGLKK